MAFILGQLKLEEFGLRPECEYASRKQQALAAYAEQRGPGSILDSEAFTEPMFEHATNSFIGSLINRYNPSSNQDSKEIVAAMDVVQAHRDAAIEANVAAIGAALSPVVNVEEKSDTGRTLSLKRDARPPLLFVFKQIVDSAIKAQRDGWQPSIVDEVIRFLKNPDAFMPMMAIDRLRANHIASICSQVVERDPRAQSDGELFYMLLSKNRSQLRQYVKELDL